MKTTEGDSGNNSEEGGELERVILGTMLVEMRVVTAGLATPRVKMRTTLLETGGKVIRAVKIQSWGAPGWLSLLSL